MTDEEALMLRKLDERVARIDGKVQELTALHDAFMTLPPGSPADEETLLVDLRRMVKRSKRVSWLSRLAMITVPALLTVLATYEAVLSAVMDFIGGKE